MNKLSNTKCNVCLRRGVTTKVRTICNECREFLCKECSDTHLFHKSSQNHSLIDLDSFGEESRAASEDELASDFLEQATVSETTVLYRAQVAVESDRTKSEPKKKCEKKSKQDVDITNVKLTKVQKFSEERPDDTDMVNVTGVLTMDDKIIVVENFMKKLKLFDQSGKYLSSTDMEQFPFGITRVHKDIFATCGLGQKVFIWLLNGETIKEKEMYHVDYNAYGIHYNNTYYCVLHCDDKTVTILGRRGRRVRKIMMKKAFGKKMEFGLDIHMDNETNNIYVPCVGDNNGVLCLSVEGEALWFSPISDAALWGITAIHGTLCIVNGRTGNQGLHMISKTGQYIGKLLGKEELTGNPHCICYNETEHKIYITFTDRAKREIISVYSLQ